MAWISFASGIAPFSALASGYMNSMNRIVILL
jgi:hypothetical protein